MPQVKSSNKNKKDSSSSSNNNHVKTNDVPYSSFLIPLMILLAKLHLSKKIAY